MKILTYSLCKLGHGIDSQNPIFKFLGDCNFLDKLFLLEYNLRWTHTFFLKAISSLPIYDGNIFQSSKMLLKRNIKCQFIYPIIFCIALRGNDGFTLYIFRATIWFVHESWPFGISNPFDFCNTCRVVRCGLFVPTQEPDSIYLGGSVDDPWSRW